MTAVNPEGVVRLGIGDLVVISNIARNDGTEGRIKKLDLKDGTLTVSSLDRGELVFKNLRDMHGYTKYSWMADDEKGESFNVEKLPGEMPRGSWLDYTDEPGDGLFGRRALW